MSQETAPHKADETARTPPAGALHEDDHLHLSADGKRSRLSAMGRVLGMSVFSSLTRRIVVLNLAALIVLVSGILYLNQFRAGLIDTRVQSLLIQGEIIAGAIAASATVETGSLSIDPDKLLELEAGQSLKPRTNTLDAFDFPINPERVAPILGRLISPTRTRARIYDREGVLILDSRHLYSQGEILRFDLPPPVTKEPAFYEKIWQDLQLWLRRSDLPLYEELGPDSGRGYPEVVSALGGRSASVVRVNKKGALIVSVAVPVQRLRAVHGTLLLSTRAGDIDAIVNAERMAIVRVALVAAAVTIVLSTLLAGTIAGPVRRLAAAAERVRMGVKKREEIPDFTDRQDEIGHLSGALRDMTQALYNRMDAIERFAADVAHELKNPLTSLRSAVETLPLAKTDNARERLLDIVQHDVKRLDRLISDISDASRLDAELSRIDAQPMDFRQFLEAVTTIAREMRRDHPVTISLAFDENETRAQAYMLQGHEGRLSQVINNLIDNACSFTPEGGDVRLSVVREGTWVTLTVDDDGPGIQAERIERIFERFYTDRPESEGFGNNSGLGLSISRQIIEAHNGTLTAENRLKKGTQDGADTRRADMSDASGNEQPIIVGARFIVRLPAMPEG